jgi:segregation and condensation protein B
MISPLGKIEGLLFASGQALGEEQISEILEIPAEEVKDLIAQLQEICAREDRGFWMVKVAGGYQLRTKPEMKELMAKFHQKKPPRLTQAMLEVLAIIAYKQPVTRPEVDRIRGVDSSGALKTLLERSLVEMKGRSDSVGNPVLYATTPRFLEWFQVGSLGDLPPLTEVEALDVMADEASDNLLDLLNRDEGFVNEDLREMDSNLKALNPKVDLELKSDEEGLSENLSENSESSEESPQDFSVPGSLNSMRTAPDSTL